MTDSAPDFIRTLAENYALLLTERLRAPPQESLVIEAYDDLEDKGLVAESRVYDILTVGGPAAWRLVLAIVEALPDDEAILSQFGVGVFEYPWCDEDKVFAVRAELEERLRIDAKLRTVVRACWSDSETLDQICERIGLQRSGT